MSLFLAQGLRLLGIQTFPAPRDFLVVLQWWLHPAKLSRLPSQLPSRYTFLYFSLPPGAIKFPQLSCLARWAWAMGSARQGQFLCFDSLPEDRQALCQLSHIPGHQETVNF